jgi:VIT1/CCC1 family predicted Fe2+/Mn2+ transporter
MDQATQLAKDMLSHKETGLQALVKEELGLDQDTLAGAPAKAAITSFFLFAIGAIIPVIPFFFSSGIKAAIIGLAASVFALFILGAGIT